MPKFGLFQLGGKTPLQEYEGDYLAQNGEYVAIYRNARNQDETDQQVAAIRLAAGHSVREIK